MKTLSDAIGQKYQFYLQKQNQQPEQQVRPSYEINVNRDEAVVNQNVIDKPFEVIIEKPVVKEIIVEKPYEVIIEKPVENRIEKEIIMERYVDNPVERIIENEVERIVEK